MSVEKKAMLGLSIPFGILTILAIAGMLYAWKAKDKRQANGDVELVDPNAPKPRTIKWNPYG